jgi:hypothetical protein
MEIIKTSQYLRTKKQLIKKHALSKSEIENTLDLFEKDPHQNLGDSDSPFPLSISTFSGMMSRATTSLCCANSMPFERPTYPVPAIAILRLPI